MIGTVAAAISGIRLAATKNFDWFGAYTVGLVTAIGGGTLRDVLLDIPVLRMQTWWYLGVTALSLATVIVFKSILVSNDRILFIFDSIGLALFCVIGIHKSLAIDYPMWVAVVMGIITGAFGGVIRDILINEEPPGVPQRHIRHGMSGRGNRLLDNPRNRRLVSCPTDKLRSHNYPSEDTRSEIQSFPSGAEAQCKQKYIRKKTVKTKIRIGTHGNIHASRFVFLQNHIYFSHEHSSRLTYYVGLSIATLLASTTTSRP